MTTPISTNRSVTTNYSAEDIERIINDFYSPTSQLSTEQRQQLNTILENLEYSKSAWDFSWKFFIYKLELDDNQIRKLFHKLIQRLILYISINSKQIITKLTMAVS